MSVPLSTSLYRHFFSLARLFMDYTFRVQREVWFWSVIYGDESFVLVSWVLAILNSPFFFCLWSHWESHDSSAVLMVLIQPDSPPAVSTKCLQVACREFFFLSHKLWSTHFTQTFLLCKFVVIIGLFPNFKQNLVLARCSILRLHAQNEHTK